MLFNEYVQSILNASDCYRLNVIEGDAYNDFLHDNITYSELIVIRNLIDYWKGGRMD